jgi:hypothetical protein
MKKINFVNNSEPYLNAENLNQLQTNIENAINEKNYLIATSTGTKTLSGNTDLTLIKVRSKGTKLTIENGKVKIGEGVSKVRVSGSIFMNIDTQASGYLWGRIVNNGNHVSGNITPTLLGMSFTSSSIPSIIIEVKENDLLGLNVDAANVSGTTRDGETTTWLCVEVIE